MAHAAPTKYFNHICLATAGITFAFDLSQPLGVAAGVPYISLVLMGLFCSRYSTLLNLTIAASLLNFVGFALSASGGPIEVVTMNRVVAFLTILLVAAAVAFVIRQRLSLERLSMIDPLTKCFNRNYLNLKLGREIASARRHEKPLSLIMLDIDHFKAVNDTHGHHEGDRVLTEIVNLFGSNIRESDFVCRFGGEEFVIVLPDADQDSALHIAERVRLAVRAASFGQWNNRITISLGVASLSLADQNAEALLKTADNALYSAKRSGRNRVIIGAFNNNPAPRNAVSDTGSY